MFKVITWEKNFQGKKFCFLFLLASRAVMGQGFLFGFPFGWTGF
jgi:hypothetical protein